MCSIETAVGDLNESLLNITNIMKLTMLTNSMHSMVGHTAVKGRNKSLLNITNKIIYFASLNLNEASNAHELNAFDRGPHTSGGSQRASSKYHQHNASSTLNLNEASNITLSRTHSHKLTLTLIEPSEHHELNVLDITRVKVCNASSKYHQHTQSSASLDLNEFMKSGNCNLDSTNYESSEHHELNVFHELNEFDEYHKSVRVRHRLVAVRLDLTNSRFHELNEFDTGSHSSEESQRAVGNSWVFKIKILIF